MNRHEWKFLLVAVLAAVGVILTMFAARQSQLVSGVLDAAGTVAWIAAVLLASRVRA